MRLAPTSVSVSQTTVAKSGETDRPCACVCMHVSMDNTTDKLTCVCMWLLCVCVCVCVCVCGSCVCACVCARVCTCVCARVRALSVCLCVHGRVGVCVAVCGADSVADGRRAHCRAWHANLRAAATGRDRFCPGLDAGRRQTHVRSVSALVLAGTVGWRFILARGFGIVIKCMQPPPCVPAYAHTQTHTHTHTASRPQVPCVPHHQAACGGDRRVRGGAADVPLFPFRPRVRVLTRRAPRGPGNAVRRQWRGIWGSEPLCCKRTSARLHSPFAHTHTHTLSLSLVGSALLHAAFVAPVAVVLLYVTPTANAVTAAVAPLLPEM